MEFKGTKGKWYVEYNGYYNEVLSTSNSYEGRVFKASTLLHDLSAPGVADLSNSEEDKANAQLISCAPEMLEMLERVREKLANGDMPDYDDYEEIEQLITKAKEV